MDNLESLKAEEAELRQKLAEIERQKKDILAERRKAEELERRRKELEKVVTVKIHSCSNGWIKGKYEPQRRDVQPILSPRSNWNRDFRFAAKVFQSEKVPALRALPNLEIEWDEEAEEKYNWTLNAPAWKVDVTITGEIICKAGPTEGYRNSLENIPGAIWSYSEKHYTIPEMECWRIPNALESTEDVVYTEAARDIIFGEIERRSRLDAIAAQEDSSVLSEGLNGEQLRPFQRVGVEFGLAANGRMLLGDDTGIGKTWQAAGLVKTLAEDVEDRERSFQTVCVVKAANIPNWVREMERLLEIEPLLVKSGKPSGEEYHRIVMDREPFILISYDTLGSKTYTKKDIDPSSTDGYYPWQQVFQSSQPDLLIMDEAHQIKNKDTHRFRAIRALKFIPHVLPMTASPVLNRTDEMWTLLHMVAPQQFNSYERFLTRYVGHDGRSPRDVEKLHELIRPMFLRRRKSDVLQDLPPINRVLRYHTLSDEATRSYNGVLQGIYNTLEHFDPRGVGGDQKEVFGILAQITRLKQVCAADKVDYTADLARDLADENDENRILIFSQFKGTAHAIARRLGHEAVCTVENRGDEFHSLNANKRDELFESVRHDPSVRFIVTTQAAKEGHNLEFCNATIFNDLFWTPEGHRQCEGRSYGRLSNPHPIDSYYIVADVDIEKWIMELLEKKIDIVEEAVDGVESSRDTSGSLATELIQKVKDAMLRQGRVRG